MKEFEEELKTNFQGEVRFDSISRHIYSVDASIFEVEPLGIAIPKSESDLQQAVETARYFQVPLTVRGAATGITGGCLGRGLIIDLSKYFTKIVEIDISRGYAVCEPGVVQDELNRQLSFFGYRLGPDTSTGNRATLGGMLSNNAAGSRSLRYGKMSDHVQEVKILLSTGKTLNFAPLSSDEWSQKRQLPDQEGEIYRVLWAIREKEAEEIKKRFPQIPRRVSGYNLDELLKPFPFNPSKLIAGSEGTLGIATQIKMGIVPKPKAIGIILFFFNTLLEAMEPIGELLKENPLSLELIDPRIIELGRASPALRNHLGWLQGNPKALLIMEMEGESQAELEGIVKNLLSRLQQKKIGCEQIPILQQAQMDHVWDLRKAGLGLLLSKRSYSRAIAFLEDISIPPHHLAPFMKEFCAYLASHGKEAGIYGHAGSGCMHIRPYIDLRDPQELALMRQMMLDLSSLILTFGGALSGEHGDGLIRSWLNPKMFGEPLMKAFRKIKTAFDPDHLMNPGKVIPETDKWEDFRTPLGTETQSPETFLDFNQEGGFALAADLCNGNGLCRKKEGVMCPSFQATNDEFHSTRARAQSLRDIVNKRIPLEEFTGQGLYDVMDLCLSCKGCKTECPSQVDMAKFKSEFLYHYQKKHGTSLRSRLFGHIGLINSWMSRFPNLFNYLNQTHWVQKGLSWIGISSKRSFPPIAKKRFSHWFVNYLQPSSLKQTVILLNDTFTEFNHPEIGQAAVSLLNALGFKVILPPWSCCGRPALSKGLLPDAKRQAAQLIQQLWKIAQEGHPIIGLEPSCLLTLRDDYVSLIQPEGEQDKQVKQILSQCMTLDEFLAANIDQEKFRSLFKTETRKVKVHGHCYQRSLVGMAPTMTLLNAIPGFQAEEIHSGCCGMAGSFGYETEHQEISMKIGELKLFPAVRKSGPEEIIIASGMSCRHQIHDGTQRVALHLAEALFNQLNH